MIGFGTECPYTCAIVCGALGPAATTARSRLHASVEETLSENWGNQTTTARVETYLGEFASLDSFRERAPLFVASATKC